MRITAVTYDFNYIFITTINHTRVIVLYSFEVERLQIVLIFESWI